MSNNTYRVEYAPTGRSSCKQAKCKKQIDKGTVRIGAIFPSERFETDGVSTDWFHPNCFFEKQKKARKTTKKVDDIDDLIGFDDLSKSDQKSINTKVDEQRKFFISKNSKPTKTKSKPTKDNSKSKPSTIWTTNENGDITTSDNENDEIETHFVSKNNNNNKKKNNNSNSNKAQAHKPTDDDDNDLFDFDPSQVKTLNQLKKTTTNVKTVPPKKPFQLKSILSPNWLPHLEPVLTSNKNLFNEIVGENRNPKSLPENNQIFASLNSVGQAKNVKVVFFGTMPDVKRGVSSGYSFCDGSADKWKLSSIKTSHKNLIRTALLDLGYITKEDTIDSIQEVLKEIDLPSDSPKDWFKSTSKQGVLWLNSISLTSIENSSNDNDSDRSEEEIETLAELNKEQELYWKPVIEEIIRTIFNSKLEEDQPSAIVFVLLGKQIIHLKQTIQLIHSEYMGAVPVEYIEGVSPVLETFLNLNYFKKINTALEKNNLTPIDWWKPKEDEPDEEEDEEEEEEQQQQEEDNQHYTIKLPPGEQHISHDNNNNNNNNSNNNTNNNRNINSNNNNNNHSNYDDNDNMGPNDKDISTPVTTPNVNCNLVQENGSKIQLKVGTPFTLGRTVLDIKDKLVSRNQAIVTLVKDESNNGSYYVELIPKGQNPIHIEKNGDYEPLLQDNSYKLNNGDTFLLCSQKYPFTVELSVTGLNISKSSSQSQPAISFSPKNKTTTTATSNKNNSNNNHKRSFEDDNESSSPANKKIATSSSSSNSKNSNTNSNKPKAKPKPKSKKKKDDFIDNDDYNDDEDDSDDDYVPPQDDDDDDDDDNYQPFIKSRSQDKPPCKYWDTCYRTNPDHLREFRHP